MCVPEKPGKHADIPFALAYPRNIACRRCDRELQKFVAERNLKQMRILSGLRDLTEVMEGKRDYISVFRDTTTSYQEHTRIHMLARENIARAVNEI